MEHDEDYKRVLAVRNELLYQLSTLHCVTKDEDAIAAIESHFNFCMSALIARKALLLQEVEVKVANKNKKIRESQKALEGVIEACDRILNTGAHLFNTSMAHAATAVWKSVDTLPEPKIIEETIQVTFQPAFLGTMASYGKIACVPTSISCIAGSVHTLAGSSRGYVDGFGTYALMNNPRGICFNSFDHCLYVCDSHNHVVRKITPEGNTTSIAITHQDPEVSIPFGITMYHKDHSMYVTDKGYHSIVRISSSGKVENFAGTGKEGRVDGPKGHASFSFPSGIAVDQRTGNLFIAETGTNSIRMIKSNGQVTTIAGAGDHGGFHYPMGLYYSDKFNCLFVCDYNNDQLRTISPSGEVYTVPCPVYRPSGVVVSSNGTIFITSLLGHKVLSITQVNGKYVAQVIAGTDTSGRKDGTAKYCSFNTPCGITLDEKTNTCYISEVENHTIRKFPLHFKYHLVETRTGYKDRWMEFFAMMDLDNDGVVEPHDTACWSLVSSKLAKFWRVPQNSEKVQRSVEGMKFVVVSFIEALNPAKSVITLSELLEGVEKFFIGNTPATMPIWWKTTVQQFFELNALDETGELTYMEFYASIKSATPEEPDEKIYSSYQWARSLSPSGKFDSTAAVVVTFIWATSQNIEHEAVTILPFWHR